MKTTGYCYHSVNVITFGLAQSDHIKRLLLYMEAVSFSPYALYAYARTHTNITSTLQAC